VSGDGLLVGVDQFAAGCLFGAQLVWTLAVIPSYRHLSPTEYLRTHTLLTWYGDALMPFLGLSTAMLGFLRYRETGHWSALAGAVALTLASIAASRNLDINNHLRAVRAGDGPAPDARAGELERNRKRWATQHFLRNLGGLIAFATALVVPSTAMTLGRPGSGTFGWMDLATAIVFVMAGKELASHVVMMRGRGRQAGMSAALGIG
jgi:Domain of unknown function (DUF1772)